MRKSSKEANEMTKETANRCESSYKYFFFFSLCFLKKKKEKHYRAPSSLAHNLRA